MNDEIRSLFPALTKYTYLNSAAVSPIPTASIDAVNAQLADVSLNGSNNYPEWIATKNRARALAAEMLGVEAEQIAFMRNTSDGFAAVANGLEWLPGDNIVSYEYEFPANFYPWRMVRDRSDVELRLCPDRGGRIDLDEFIGMIDRNTKLVSISAVQYGTGFRADLERIGRAARDIDALFAVDIIQGFGAFGFDLPAQFVDIASGASHKWLCAPEGCGILYISDRARERVEPTFVGWISVETPWDFADRAQAFKPNALAWESGTGASSLFYGLEQSLKLLNDTGLEKIEKYLEGLSDELCEGLDAKDYDIVSSRKPGEKSAIVCLKHRGGENCNSIAERLMAENIIVSPRNDVLRIAPHFYNNSRDIQTLVEALT
jgi:selenocysteine lyase/cysteine desulfurase